MKNLILLFSYLACYFLFTGALSAQVNSNQKPQKIIDVIQSMEKNGKYRFYYDAQWLDSLLVKRDNPNLNLKERLSLLFEHTKLDYFFLDNRIILSYNSPIIKNLPDGYWEVQDERETDLISNVFSRELSPLDEANATEKDSLIEIGKKSALSRGGLATLAGYIREKASGEPIVGALVYTEKPFRSVVSNEFGFYSLNLNKGSQILKVRYAGMQELELKILLYEDGKLDIGMEDAIISLKEITVESDKEENVLGLQTGLEKLDVRAMKNIPKILGENDIIKVTLALPGVQTVGEAALGFNVRGGASDQNLILLNEAPIYNPSHFLGFFSVFNADVIKSSQLYKSGIPVRFGGRLSSVLEVQLKEGNKKKFSGQGGISPITSRLSFEIPVVREKSSLILGGRSTYSDWVLNQVPDESIRNSDVLFYDLVARYSHQINPNNSLFISGYFSKDRFRLSTDTLFSYQNANTSIQWRHIFNNKFNAVITGLYSQYNYEFDYDEIPVNAFRQGFKIQESGLKLDFNYYLGEKHRLEFGWDGKFYQLNPGFIRPNGDESLVNSLDVAEERALEHAFYLADNFEINSKLSLYLGLRYSFFTALGPRDVFTYDPSLPRDINTIQDTVSFSGKIIDYSGPEYRASLRYLLNTSSSLKLSYNRTRQYIHLLSNTIAVAPTDTWKLSDPNIRPQLADQLAIGYYKNLRNNTLEFSIEAYYKWLDNILDYKVGADLLLNNSLETQVLQGKGKAYGVELLLRKKKGKLNGWMSYTFSRSLIQLDSPFASETINNGRFFPTNYDKPHDFTLVSNYKFTRRYSLSLNMTFNTGRPVTYPVAQYEFGGSQLIFFSDRNEFRIPNYFRLDVGLNIEGNHKIKKLAHSFWTISIYNVTGRDNAYSVFFVTQEDGVQPLKLSIFAWPIPTITYNFRF